MSSLKISDLIEITKEMDRARNDKTRTIDSISNKEVKSIIKKESDIAYSSGLTKSLILVNGAITSDAIGKVIRKTQNDTFVTEISSLLGGVAVGIGGAAVGGAVGAGGAAVGGAVGAGGAAVGGAVGAGGAAGLVSGVAGGAAAGAPVPIIGPIVGAAVGAVVGVGAGYIAGHHKKVKTIQEKERLFQEVQKKQNSCIRDLEKEVNELKQKYGEAVYQNERYKYIIGILLSNEELKRFS